jgi:hypothetical protein
MNKLGRAYEKLIALVAEALHPAAEISVGEWTTGPDGVREIDVSVRGLIDGQQTSILIECKDKSSDVGIGDMRSYRQTQSISSRGTQAIG